MHPDEVAAQAAGLRRCSGTGMSMPPGLVVPRTSANDVGATAPKNSSARAERGSSSSTWPERREQRDVRVNRVRLGPGTGMTMLVLSRGLVERARRGRSSRSCDARQGLAYARPAMTLPPLAARCASTSRRPTSRPSRSGTGARKGGSSSGTATRAARTTSTRGRSARSAGATTSSGRRRAGRATLYTYSVVHQNDLPPFNERVPYVAAVVELDEGPRVMTNVDRLRVRRARDRHAGRASTSSRSPTTSRSPCSVPRAERYVGRA